ncbi:zinc ribbon domain-containing protein [Millisia brevis]|uniref:zinc ribbon domain-containing protein n=1 Tax=Millisia brevis TaxID=264148 RepID=UPI00082C3D69|nr:C4-type zinc ribbon domain-containing protein [Millisia brevis]
MDVDPGMQRRLLDLAAVDTELTQLRHRLGALPEEKDVERLARERNAAKDAAVAIGISIDDLDTDIRRLEGEVDAVRRRLERDQQLLAAGSAPAKQLSEIQHEVGSLERRQALLEDEMLGVMEQREALQSDHDRAGAQLDHVESQLVEAEKLVQAAVGDLDERIADRTTARAAVVGDIDSALIEAYDRQRERSGVGAALLRARRCGGCRLELDRGEIARIAAAPPTALIRCSECGTILVRTFESGL